jgi:hypothetical protein
MNLGEAPAGCRDPRAPLHRRGGHVWPLGLRSCARQMTNEGQRRRRELHLESKVKTVQIRVLVADLLTTCCGDSGVVGEQRGSCCSWLTICRSVDQRAQRTTAVWHIVTEKELAVQRMLQFNSVP